MKSTLAAKGEVFLSRSLQLNEVAPDLRFVALIGWSTRIPAAIAFLMHADPGTPFQAQDQGKEFRRGSARLDKPAIRHLNWLPYRHCFGA